MTFNMKPKKKKKVNTGDRQVHSVYILGTLTADLIFRSGLNISDSVNLFFFIKYLWMGNILTHSDRCNCFWSAEN